jgi:hypothetical protein
MLMLLQSRKEISGRFYRRTRPQILDLLQFSRQEMEHKELFLKLKKRLHKIDGRYDGEKDALIRSRLCGQRQVLRRKAGRAALIYRIVRRERIRLFRDYISSLPLRTKGF